MCRLGLLVGWDVPLCYQLLAVELGWVEVGLPQSFRDEGREGGHIDGWAGTMIIPGWWRRCRPAGGPGIALWSCRRIVL